MRVFGKKLSTDDDGNIVREIDPETGITRVFYEDNVRSRTPSTDPNSPVVQRRLKKMKKT